MENEKVTFWAWYKDMIKTKDQHEKWTKIRTKGIGFSILQGIFVFGIPWAILFVLAMRLLFNDRSSELLVYSFIGGPLSGVLFGVVAWFYGERKFKKKMNNQQQ